jgi:hypothetical protein
VSVLQHGSPGAAYSILISPTSSALLSLRWSGSDSIRYIAASILSIFAGLMLAQITEIFVDHAKAAILV